MIPTLTMFVVLLAILFYIFGFRATAKPLPLHLIVVGLLAAILQGLILYLSSDKNILLGMIPIAATIIGVISCKIFYGKTITITFK